jgi:hypothetical protein
VTFLDDWSAQPFDKGSGCVVASAARGVGEQAAHAAHAIQAIAARRFSMAPLISERM